MRLVFSLFLGLLPRSAAAHQGHIADVAGHGHWVGVAAIGLAVLVGLWGKLKDRKPTEDDNAEESPQEEVAA